MTEETIYTLAENTEPPTYLYWLPGMTSPARFDKSMSLKREDYTAREYLFLLRFRDGTARLVSPEEFTERTATLSAAATSVIQTDEENDDRWPEWLICYQQQEQAEARQWAERVSQVFKALHLALDPIDWQGQGRMAYVFSSGVEVGALSDLQRMEPKQVLDKVRRHLVEAAAGKQLHTSAGRAYLCTRITPEPGMVSLWRVRLDGYEQGVSIAENTREGKRVYEYYGGPINT